MKLKLAFGFLPYLLIPVDKIARTLNAITVGRTLGFVVLLDEDKAHPSVVPHEEVHVAFFYAAFALTTAAILLTDTHYAVALFAGFFADKLLGILKPYKVFEESIGYAREASLRDDPEAYIQAESDHWRLKYDDSFPRLVRKRLKWFQ